MGGGYWQRLNATPSTFGNCPPTAVHVDPVGHKASPEQSREHLPVEQYPNAESEQLMRQPPPAPQYCPVGQSLFFSHGPALAQLIAAGTTTTREANKSASTDAGASPHHSSMLVADGARVPEDHRAS